MKNQSFLVLICVVGAMVMAVLAQTPNVCLPSAPIVTAICTASSVTCVVLNLTGDPDSGNPSFNGKADPSIAKDPNTGTLFMCYSWTNASNGAGVIDTHIAKSTNGGVSWTYVGDLYPTQTQTDTTAAQTVYSSNEVCKILPINNGNGTTSWLVSRLNYWSLGSGGGQLSYSRRFSVAVGLGTSANGPYSLLGVTPQWIGTSANTSQYPIDVNFQTIDSHMNVCTTLREPTALIDPNDGKLVYLIQCGNLQFGAQFVTNTAPTAGNWVWTFVSGSQNFAVPADAADLCTHTNGCALPSLALSEMDISINAAGTGYGTVVSVGSYAASIQKTGCVWAELDTSSRPYLFKKTAGIINVDATLTSSDSLTHGPGACGYSPNAGMMIVHNITSGVGSQNYIMQSILKP